MKRFFALLVFTIVLVPAFAQQLTTVGVIDSFRIYTTYFSQSAAVREVENFRADFQAELNRHAQELRTLQQRKIEADARGDEAAALRLNDEIFQKGMFIQDFQRIRQRQLEQMQTNLTQNDAFLQQLQSAVRLVAEAAGFTVILDAGNPALQWWSQEVDITDRVIARLRGRL